MRSLDADIQQSNTYSYIMIVLFLITGGFLGPVTVLFTIIWCLLLRKQNHIMSLFNMLPKDVIGSIYQDIKKRTRENGREVVYQYEGRIIFFFLLVLILFGTGGLICFSFQIFFARNNGFWEWNRHCWVRNINCIFDWLNELFEQYSGLRRSRYSRIAFFSLLIIFFNVISLYYSSKCFDWIF